MGDVDIQIEHAYWKEQTVFQNKNSFLLRETGEKKLLRCYKNIGLGFKKEATEAPVLTDAHSVSIQGQALSGVEDEDAEDPGHPLRPPLLRPGCKLMGKRHEGMSVLSSPCPMDV
ncbi:40S ribosomal protein S11-like [Talpa occidentalis]|uniref:40S ribosomal protein S11-like n=1 Tax=Talpa occidentalis TaxID=50954 RepID=UPI00188FB363|nr:40S ribosomal protein S11-like [Talpa occidentalis]